MQNIIQGGLTNIAVRLQQVLNGVIGDPVDLTGVTEIVTCFQNTDGTEVTLTLTGGAVTILGNPILGKIGIQITAAQTTLMKVTDGDTLELAITYGSADPVKTQIPNAYAVLQSQC